MSVPRHLLQRPRRRLPPPAQRGVGPAVVAEEVVVEPEVVVEVTDAAPAVVDSVVVVEPEVVAVVEPEVAPVVEAVVQPEPEDVVVEPAPAPAPTVAWNPTMKKADLVAIATAHGLAVTVENTKAEIIDALRTLG